LHANQLKEPLNMTHYSGKYWAKCVSCVNLCQSRTIYLWMLSNTTTN